MMDASDASIDPHLKITNLPSRVLDSRSRSVVPVARRPSQGSARRVYFVALGMVQVTEQRCAEREGQIQEQNRPIQRRNGSRIVVSTHKKRYDCVPILALDI